MKIRNFDLYMLDYPPTCNTSLGSLKEACLKKGVILVVGRYLIEKYIFIFKILLSVFGTKLLRNGLAEFYDIYVYIQ